MIDVNTTLTRRTLIRSMSAAGGMILGFQVPGAVAAVIAPKPWTTPTNGAEINAWLTIDADGTVTTPGERVVSVELSDGTVMISDGTVAADAPDLTIVTNSFTAAGGDNYPWLGDNPNKVQFPVTYEQAWVEFMLTFPAGGTGLPTIPGDNGYQEGGEGRITMLP